MDPYQIGQVATLSTEFLNGSGSLADPATVSLTITSPSGMATTYTFAALQITKDAVGKYSMALTVNAAGAWTWQWNSTGTPTTTETGYLVVVSKGSDGIHDSVQPWASLAELAAQNTSVAAATGAQVGLAEWFLQVASNLAYAASGRQYPGLVESVVRPCRWYEGSAVQWPDWWSVGQSGWDQYGRFSYGFEPHRDCGVFVSEVWLADALQAVIEVRVNGAVVAPTAYQIVDRSFLQRIDGQAWPLVQDLSQDATLAASTNSFQITYLRGKMPPPEGRQAVIDMAGEFYAAKSGSDCALPDAIAQLVREGETLSFETPTGIDLFHTGIRSWDFFISAQNPAHRQRRATIISPDVTSRYRHIGAN